MFVFGSCQLSMTKHIEFLLAPMQDPWARWKLWGALWQAVQFAAETYCNCDALLSSLGHSSTSTSATASEFSFLDSPHTQVVQHTGVHPAETAPSERSSHEPQSSSGGTRESATEEAVVSFRIAVHIKRNGDWTPMLRRPSSQREEPLYKDKQAFRLRQALLRGIGDSNMLDTTYNKKILPFVQTSDGQTHAQLFELLHAAWKGSALLKHGKDCGKRLDEIRDRAETAGRQVLADTYYSWYAASSMRTAKQPRDFQNVARRLERAFGIFALNPGMDRLFVAELLQATVDLVSRVVSLGHFQDLGDCLPVAAFMHGERMRGQSGAKAVAEALWHEAFTVFREAHCYLDAVALCMHMVVLSEPDAASTYIRPLRSLLQEMSSDRIFLQEENSEQLQLRLEAHVNMIEGMLKRNEPVGSKHTDLSNILTHPLPPSDLAA